jgi:hypothetical protein
MRKRRLGTVAGSVGVAGSAVAGTCAIAMMAAAPANTGCTTHQCDPSYAAYMPQTGDAGPDFDASGGFMIDENTFVTSALDGDWMLFPGNASIQIFFPPQVAGRVPLPPTGYVATARNPNSLASLNAGATFTTASGQLSLYNAVLTADAGGSVGGSFYVKNGGCQTYYAWFSVDFVPVSVAPPDAAAADVDAGGADAGTPSADDASSDAAAVPDVPDAEPPDAANDFPADAPSE